MKNYFRNICVVAFSTIIFTSCSKDEVQAPSQAPVQNTPNANSCNTSNTLFNQMYNLTDLASTGVTNQILGDTSTYEYTFLVNTNSTVCSIGMASIGSNNVPYRIIIKNLTTNIDVYDGVLNFDSGNTNYRSISPVALIVGNQYVIRRITLVKAHQNTRGLGYGNINFPIDEGPLRILGANIYGDNTTLIGVSNLVLPYIDMVFQ
jgi:hypothetical protein